MDIRSAEFSLTARHDLLAWQRTQEQLDIRIDPPAQTRALADAVELSAGARALADTLPDPSPAEGTGAAGAIEQAAEDAEDDPELGLLLRLIEFLTGREAKLFDVEALRDVEFDTLPPLADPSQRRAGFALDYAYSQVREEIERTQVQGEGVIRTAEGEEIRFRLSLTMARHYREETTVRLQIGDPVRKDPLVVNYGGHAAELSNARFRFDLDGDGVSEAVPLLGGGSGFLVLDRNGDGRVNSGTELFGARTGDGFAELEILDDDRDGWIDAADAAHERLRLWTPTADGGGRLVTLDEGGVAAISTASVTSPFELRGDGNADLGAVRSTGLYVSTAKSVGTVQQIDLSV